MAPNGSGAMPAQGPAPARNLAPAAAPLPAWLPWVVGGVFALILLGIDAFMSRDGIIANSVVWGRDFINVWTGGQLVRAGRLDIVYDLDAYVAFQKGIFGGINAHNYSYPPISFPLAALFSFLPYHAALAAWLGGTGALFVWAARPWWPARAGPAWLAILTPAALINIWAGHYGFLVGALLLLGWRHLDARPLVAGVFFGLLLIKPHLAILVPLVLLLRREWTALASGAATVALLVAASTLAYGWGAWHDYLFGVSAVQANMIDSGSIIFGRISTSVATAFLWLGMPWALAMAFQAGAGAFGLALVIAAARRGVPTRPLALLAATATFLVLPYAFNYDLPVVMIGAVALIARGDLGESDRRLAVFGFMAPQVGMVLALYNLPVMWLMLAGLAYAQYRVAVRDADQARSAASAAAM